jgi:L-aminopeptidase/D-esterase-like protein
VVFAGGSAFGLSTADGVLRYLAERGQGYPTAGGVVPIVPTACIFDLAEADGPPPGPAEGYAAAVAAARDERTPGGRIGAGAGATVGKWKGREHAAPSGLAVAHADVEGARVAALAVVNAVGDVIGADGSVVAGSAAPPEGVAFPTPAPFEETAANTTLVALVTDASLDKAGCLLLAHSAHDGFARALHPAHTRYDGDLAVVVATGSATVPADPSLDRLRIAATTVTADAIRAAPR